VQDLSVTSSRPQRPLRTQPFHQWEFPDGTLWAEFHRTHDGYLLRFPKLADFTVSRDGANVACFPTPGVSEATAQHLFLNQVLPLALSKQGRLVFHASAVEVESGAVAFVGESGRGKSTLAATFATSGHRFLTDDGLVVAEVAGGYEVIPSHPSIRLWADSEAVFVGAGTIRAPAVDFTSKSRFLAGDEIRFCDQPRLLRRVYFLGDGSARELTIELVKPSEAVVEWVKHSFLLDIEEKPRLASHFDEVAKVAILPIHYRLDYPRRFESLAAVRRAIVEHAQDETSAA